MDHSTVGVGGSLSSKSEENTEMSVDREGIVAGSETGSGNGNPNLVSAGSGGGKGGDNTAESDNSVTDTIVTPGARSGLEEEAKTKRLESIVDKEERKAAAKTLRIKYASILWPTAHRYKEYTSQSGRDADPEQKHIHIAHLLNVPEFDKAFKAYLAMPETSSDAKNALKRCRELAVQFSFTKEKRKAANLAKEAEEKRVAEERKRKRQEETASNPKHVKGSRLSKPVEDTSKGKTKGGKKSQKGAGHSAGAGSRLESSRPQPQQQQQQQQQRQQPPEGKGLKRPLQSTSSAGSVSGHRGQHPRVHSPERPVKERLGVNAQHKPILEDDEDMDGDGVTLHPDADDMVFDNDDDNDTARGQTPCSSRDSTQHQGSGGPGSQSGAGNQEDGDSYSNAAKPAGEWRVIVLAGGDGTQVFTRGMWEKFRHRFYHLVAVQQEDLDQTPILLDDVWFHGGRVFIEPANEESRDKVVAIVKDKIQVNGHSFLPQLSKDLPPTVTLSFRLEGPGKVDALLLCPKRGICRLNGWDPSLAKGIRVLKYPDSDTGVRYVRVACTEEVVAQIKRKEGLVYCGVGRASVQWKKQLVRSDLEITFTSQ